MQLTESFYMKRNKSNYDRFDQLVKWMKIANDLYNQSLYIVKKYWEERKGQSDQYDLKIDVVMKEMPNLDGEINYRLMPNASAAQQITRLLEQNIKSFYASLKSYREHPERWKARPQFPKFRKKGSRFLLIFTGQRAKIEGSKLQLTKDFFLNIPKSNLRIGDDPLDQVRILPVTRDRIKIENGVLYIRR